MNFTSQSLYGLLYEPDTLMLGIRPYKLNIICWHNNQLKVIELLLFSLELTNTELNTIQFD